MSFYADKIRASSVAHYRPGQQDTSATDMRAVAAEVAEAVEFLEGLVRGAQIEFGSGAPGAAVGQPGDAYIDVATGDVHGYDAGTGWQLKGSFRGKDGTTPVKGRDYQDGRTPQKGVDYKDGANGKSAFELYKEAGGPLGLPAWLASLPGKPGLDGDAGNRTRWESIAPTANDAGAVGDTWFFAQSASKLLIYECYRTAAVAAADPAGGGQWRLRYTSPDAPAAITTTTTTTGGTVKSVSVNNGTAQNPDANGNVNITVSATSGSSLPTQAGNAGKVLSTDGTTAVWAAAASGLPTQGGNAGKVLGTNGTAAVWVPNGLTVTVSKKVMPLTFIEDADYENNIGGAPISGAVTADYTNAVRGCTVGMFHRDSSEPLLPSEFNRVGGAYVAGRTNYYSFTYVNAGLVLYNIAQLSQ